MNIELFFLKLQIPLLLLLIGAEALWCAILQTKTYHLKDTANNILFTSLNFGLDMAMKGLNLAILYFFLTYSFFKIENPWLYWFSLVLCEDLMYYTLHYVDHHVRLFWAVHVTHHSSEKMNLTIGFRSSVFQPLYRVVYFIPLVLLGYHPLDIALVYALTQFWGIFVHTELIGKLGWLEYILVTPSHHRVHHASNIEYLDKNLGMLFIFWDKIFGTFQSELLTVKLHYGLVQKTDSYHPLHNLFYEWRNIYSDLKLKVSWKKKWRYIFGLPGWSHDGSRATSEQMRMQQKIVHNELGNFPSIKK